MNTSSFAMMMAGFLLLEQVGAQASELGELAAGMVPGEWAELKTNGYTIALISTGTDNILNYSNSAVWDPVKREVRFVGQGHNEAEKMIVYSESDNSWKGGSGPNSGGIGHGYDHNAINPATGVSYYRKFGSGTVFQYDGSWSPAPSLEGMAGSSTCCGSLTWFPEMNALTFWAGGNVDVLKEGKWTTVGNKPIAMGEYHNISEYSAPYGLVFGGGGNNDKHLHALDAAGKLTAIPEAPVSMGIYSALVVADPASGELIVVSRDKSIWSYHHGKTTWAPVAPPAVNLFVNEDIPIKFMIAAPIPAYDVIMFIKKDVLFLYKHKAQDPVSIRGRNRVSAPGPESIERFISPGGMLPGFAEWGSEYRDVSGRLSRFPAILLR